MVIFHLELQYDISYTESWGPKESNAIRIKSVAPIAKELQRRKDRSIFNSPTVTPRRTGLQLSVPKSQRYVTLASIGLLRLNLLFICSGNQCLFYSLLVLLFIYRSTFICLLSFCSIRFVWLFSVQICYYSVCFLFWYWNCILGISIPFTTTIQQSINIIHQTAPSLS